MEGANLLTDGAVNHDHSYYGNGCTNPFDTTKPDEGYGGSTKSCSTRIINTFDNENQKNGTYYTYVAATSGAGGASVTTDYAIIPDSFCPLGWQLPYGGTGGDYYDKSRSWQYLFLTYGIQGNFNKILSYPTSFVRPGDYRLGLGRLFEMTRINHQWSNTNKQGANAYRLYNNGQGSPDNKTIAMTIRCVTRK